MPAVITLTGEFGAETLAALDQQLPAFEQANRSIVVDVVDLGEEEIAPRDALASSLSAHSSDIDLMVLEESWAAEFAERGWLLPLDGVARGCPKSTDTAPALPATTRPDDGMWVTLPLVSLALRQRELSISAYSSHPAQAFRLAAFLAELDGVWWRCEP